METTTEVVTETPAAPPVAVADAEMAAEVAPEEKPVGWQDVVAASAGAVRKDPPPKIFTAPVKVRLTAQETRDLIAELDTERSKLPGFEATKKAAAGAHKAQVEKVDGLTSILCDLDDDGYTMREILLEQEERIEYETGRVVIVRRDTGEQLSERALSLEERQPSLFGERPAATLPDAAPKKALAKGESPFDENGQYIGPQATDLPDDGAPADGAVVAADADDGDDDDGDDEEG